MNRFSVSVFTIALAIFIGTAETVHAKCRGGNCQIRRGGQVQQDTFQIGSPFTDLQLQQGGVVDPTVNSDVGQTGGVGGGVTTVGGSTAGTGASSNGIHTRSAPLSFVNGSFVEAVNVRDPSVRVAELNTIVVDPNTGQRIQTFPGMFIIDSGTVFNGQRVYVPASKESAEGVLKFYTDLERQGRLSPRRQAILNNYRRFLPGMFQQAGGTSQVGDTAASNTGGGTGTQTPPVAGRTHGGAADPTVQETRSSRGGTGRNTFWSEWKTRYENAQKDWKKETIHDQIASLAKPVEGKKYSVKVIRQNCASKQKPRESKPMTLFAFSSKKDGGTLQTHLVVRSGHVAENAEAAAIEEAWNTAKIDESGSDLGSTMTPDASAALVNAFSLPESQRKIFQGYTDVQMRVRPVLGADGKITDLVTKQVIKHGDDVNAKRWGDSDRDQNLFCVTAGSSPQKPTHPPQTTGPDPVNQVFKTSCLPCHGGDRYTFRVNKETGEPIGFSSKEDILRAVKGELEGVDRMPKRRDALSASDIQLIEDWSKKK